MLQILQLKMPYIKTQELNRCMHLYFKVSSHLGNFTKAEKYDLFFYLFIN